VSGRSKDQGLIDELAAWMQAPDPKTAKTNGHTAPAPTPRSAAPTDEMIIQKCRGAENAAKFVDLFDYGDTSGNGGDASGADFALLGILKFYTQDPDQLERLMRRSRLTRPKWDEGRAGRSWLRYSIDNALKDVGEVYDWGRQRSRPLVSSPSSALGVSSDDDTSEGDDTPEIVWFAELGEPKEREYLIEKIGV
jgi:primase-polymerase (primpol)-like protein